MKETSFPVRRGEMWLAVLDPTIGSAIQKTRPCLIISPPETHDYLPVVTIAPMTTKSHPAPYHVPAMFKDKSGFILLEQIRTIDKRRLIRRLGPLDNTIVADVLFRLQQFFKA